VHLLIVEDDERLSRLLRRLLTQDRHLVETATTAEEGLEIATSGLELDAIVLDVGLPDRSGFEVARLLRKKGNSVPILMLTTWSSRSPTRSSWPASGPWAGGRPPARQSPCGPARSSWKRRLIG
jgi:DNA-binding response OmpR family regulator